MRYQIFLEGAIEAHRGFEDDNEAINYFHHTMNEEGEMPGRVVDTQTGEEIASYSFDKDTCIETSLVRGQPY